MNKSLYFPYLNIPESCPALGTLLLLSDEINIIAPEGAPIDSELTRKLVNEGLLRRISPVDVLDKRDLDEIVLNTLKYKHGSMRSEIPVHFEKMGQIHGSKLNTREFNVNIEKVGVHWEKILHSRGLGRIDQRGFVHMPAEKAMYLMGQIAKKISYERKLKVFSSTNANNIREENAVRMHGVIEAVTLDLLPSVDYSHHGFDIVKLCDVRDEYKKDLQHYAQEVTNDLKTIIGYWNEGFADQYEQGLDFLIDAKNGLIDQYSKEYEELCKAISANERIRLYTVGIGAVLPSVLAVAALDNPEYAAAFTGLSSLGTLAGALVQNREIPNRLNRHKVVLNIRKQKKVSLRGKRP